VPLESISMVSEHMTNTKHVPSYAVYLSQNNQYMLCKTQIVYVVLVSENHSNQLYQLSLCILQTWGKEQPTTGSHAYCLHSPDSGQQRVDRSLHQQHLHTQGALGRVSGTSCIHDYQLRMAMSTLKYKLFCHLFGTTNSS